jgi:hypothetical protein
MPIIQAVTISGRFINKAKWEVDTLANLREGHNIQVSLPVKDKNLISFLTKSNKINHTLEKIGNKFSVILTMKLTQFRHMLDTNPLDFQSMAVVTPLDRTIEGILLYLLSKNECDPRFVALIKGTSSTNKED